MSVPKTSKVPILKITINKKYNRPRVSKVDENKLSLNISDTDIICEVEKNEMNETTDPSLLKYTGNIVAPPKAVVFNLIPVNLIPVLEKSANHKDTFMETRQAYTPKVAYTRRGNLSRDTTTKTATTENKILRDSTFLKFAYKNWKLHKHPWSTQSTVIRNQSIAERVKYLHTKAQRDCDVLRIRLKALRERHKHEKKEIKRLHIYLGNLSKNKSIHEIAKRHLKRETSFVSLQNAEEDECEKLLRKVRKIKQEMLDLKYPITTFKEMNEENHNANTANGEYKISLKNSIYGNEDTSNSAIYNSETESSDNEAQKHEENYVRSGT